MSGSAAISGAAVNAGVHSFAAVSDGIVDGLLRASPAWARQAGLHAFDGKLARYDAAGLAAHAEFLERAATDLDRVAVATLSKDEALDRAILKSRLEFELFNLRERALPFTDPRFYEELFDVGSYVKFEYAPLADRARSLVEHEEAALAQLDAVTTNLRAELSRPILETAIASYRGYAEYLRGDVVKLVGKVGDGAFQARFAKSNAALADAASALAGRLEREWLPRSNDTAHVLGREKFLRFVAAQEGRGIELAEFEAMAEADLARNKSAYETLLPTVKVTRPAASALLGEATRMMEASRAFVLKKELVTIPSEDRAVLEESPPYMRWNAAFLSMPGPFDTVRKGFYYITLPDPSWPKDEQEAYIFPIGTLLATTVHEVYPGHFLHGLFIRRAPTRIQKLGDSYSFTEGWAHYVEQLMIDEGFGAEEPQSRVGQLADALLRNCRFVVSIGVHAKGVTLAEAEQRFMRDCAQDKASARQQAVRATFDPGYFAYTLGKLQILALRAEAQKALGARFNLRAFHDALLGHGAPPVALIRERVLAELGVVR
ncbi:MAG: DUF885 domain-containing protein [Myxococcales bacterium]|nr:DUF885 domain-containing protein [Myxococcales bacterium]